MTAAEEPSGAPGAAGAPEPSPVGDPSGAAGTEAAACGPDGVCITCSDEGVPMTVVSLLDPGLALCEGEEGGRRDVLIGLVPDAAPGDRLLVHAGTALLRQEDR